jgi:preprotein translocase subunit SecG
MTFVYWIFMTLHILACLFLIGVVLLQQGKGQDLASAFGGGGTQTAFGPRGSANVLSRATTVLAGMFMVTSLGLSVLKMRSTSILDKVPAATSSPAPAPGAPTVSLPAAAPAASVPAAPASSAPAAPAPSPSAQ